MLLVLLSLPLPPRGVVDVRHRGIGRSLSKVNTTTHRRRAGAGAPHDWWICVEGAAKVVETSLEARALAASGNELANHAVED